MASTPSIELEQDSDSGLITRRSSSGGLLSPEVELGAGAKGTAPSLAEGEQDGFYLLKKDSQRRTTLSRVLAQDGAKICEVWMTKIHTQIRTKYLGETVKLTLVTNNIYHSFLVFHLFISRNI